VSFRGLKCGSETDEDGLADIDVPVTMLGKAVNVSVAKDGYEGAEFRGTIEKDGTLTPAHLKYPPMEKKAEPHIEPNNRKTENNPAQTTVVGGTLLGVIVVLGVFLGWTEVGKFGLLSFMMPLYTRINKECVLDNFTRGMIYGHIRENPGIYFTELMNMAEVSAGALTYHLKALEREGLILSRSQGFHRALFPASMKVSKWELILNKTEMLVFNIIRSNPGISQQKIAKKTALNKMSVSRLVKSLEEKEFITVERGKFNRCRVREDKMVLDGQGSGTSAYSALDR
jgi:predicted transcriptional regulator